LLVERANGLINLGPAHIEIVVSAVRDLDPALADEVNVLSRTHNADQLYLVLQSGLDDGVHHDGGRGVIRRVDPVNVGMSLQIADNHLPDGGDLRSRHLYGVGYLAARAFFDGVHEPPQAGDGGRIFVVFKDDDIGLAARFMYLTEMSAAT